MVSITVKKEKKKFVKPNPRFDFRRVEGGGWEKVTDANRNKKWAGGGGKKSGSREFDRAVKSKVMLSSKKETERKKEAERRGIKYIPGQDVPSEEFFKEKEKGKITARETAKKELAEKEEIGQKTGVVKEDLNLEDLTEEQRALIESGTINKDFRQLEDQPLMADQPAGVQALQGGLLDLSITGGSGTVAGLGMRGRERLGGFITKTPKEIVGRTNEGIVIVKNTGAVKRSVISRVKDRLDIIGGKNTGNIAKKAGNVNSDGLMKLAKIGGITFLFTQTASEQGQIMWASADNIATSASMGSNALLDQVTFAEIPPSRSEVEDQKELLRSEITKARGAIKTAAWLNPITGYPRWKFYSSVIDTQEDTMNRNFELVDSKMGIEIEQPETTDL